MSCDLGSYPVNKGEPHLIYDVKLEHSGRLLSIAPYVYPCLFDGGSPHVYNQGSRNGNKPGLDLLSSQSILVLTLSC
jgi:hypothetical protein